MISISDYQGTNIEKAFGIDEKIHLTPELIKQSLDEKLEKGLIDQPLYDKAVEQLNGLIEKAGKGEGSRGGKVIGHTKSGHPIYDMIKKYKHDSNYHIKESVDHNNEPRFTIGKQDGTGHYTIGGNEKDGYYINSHAGNVHNPDRSGNATWNHSNERTKHEKYKDSWYRHPKEHVENMLSKHGIDTKKSKAAKEEIALKAASIEKEKAIEQKKKQIEHHMKHRDMHADIARYINDKYGSEAHEAYNHHSNLAAHHHREVDKLDN